MSLRIAATAVALASFMVLTACDPWDVVEYRNDTSERLLVYHDGEYQFDLEPGQTRRVAMDERWWPPNLRVTTADGRVILEDFLSYEELRALDMRIIISDANA
jgi:hypothetical protein